jgi:hypothetical protein
MRSNDVKTKRTLDALHKELIIESTNAIDEAMGESVDNMHDITQENGSKRSFYDAHWRDAEDKLCTLKSYTQITTGTAIFFPSKTEKVKLSTNFYLTRRQNDAPSEKYYFNGSNDDVVQLVNEVGRPIPNDTAEEDLRYLTIVLKSIRERDTRKVPDQDIVCAVALESMMVHQITLKLIESIDQSNSTNVDEVERLIAFILYYEPILSDRMVRSRIEEELNRRRSARKQLRYLPMLYLPPGSLSSE